MRQTYMTTTIQLFPVDHGCGRALGFGKTGLFMFSRLLELISLCPQRTVLHFEDEELQDHQISVAINQDFFSNDARSHRTTSMDRLIRRIVS